MKKVVIDFEKTVADFGEVFADLLPGVAKSIPGANFMTPDILGTFEVGEHFVEVSTGVFGSDRLFAATVASKADPSEKNEHSGLFHDCSSIESVREHYNKLAEKISA